jgi:hypothetical protein
MTIPEALQFCLDYPITGRVLLINDVVISCLIMLAIDLGKTIGKERE